MPSYFLFTCVLFTMFALIMVAVVDASPNNLNLFLMWFLSPYTTLTTLSWYHLLFLLSPKLSLSLSQAHSDSLITFSPSGKLQLKRSTVIMKIQQNYAQSAWLIMWIVKPYASISFIWAVWANGLKGKLIAQCAKGQICTLSGYGVKAVIVIWLK